MELSPLTAISPIDGRYADKTSELRTFFSEFALIRNRTLIEIRWLQTLAEIAEIPEITPLSDTAIELLDGIHTKFSEEDAKRIKSIEQSINHDIKAVEYFLKEKVKSNAELTKISEFFHFACTSDDINNVAYALMLQTARKECLLPIMDDIIHGLTEMAHTYADQAMLGRTHGQAATPTTVGKEIANYVMRLRQERQKLNQCKIFAKFNGAVGNFNAHYFAYPDIDWENVSKIFIEKFGLTSNEYTTQIEPHDYIAEYCDAIARFNNILIAFNSDIWSYIALGYFKLKSNNKEVGSSTMPHKVNPIDFENSEGNLSLANAILHHLANHLPRSRWQRDLRDSTLLRNLGIGVAYSVIAYKSLIKGLNKLEVDPNLLAEDLEHHWEILAEAIQTLLRRCNVEAPYEKLKELTKGKTIEKTTLEKFIHELKVPDKIKQQLLQLTPQNYLGIAAKLAKRI